MADAGLSSSAAIEIRAVSKLYRTQGGGEIVAVSPTDLLVRRGEFVSVVGPSGCGKTTLLNMIAGLIKPTSGSIRVGDDETAASLPIGYVFQRPVLLPWRTVLDNVLLPIEVLRLKPLNVYVEKARELLAMVGLGGFENVYPGELSGGMQQRAAIVRSLVYDSGVLLLDEPFAALDAMTRDDLNLELLRIWELTGRSIVFVTHNIPEAVLLSDRVVVMTPRPGQVKDIVTVDLARPRTLSMLGDRRFGELADHIRGMLKSHASTRAA